jgi:hypothetical protein
MVYSISATAKKAVFDQQTEEVFLILLEIDHDNLATPLRVVNNYENITSNGDLYYGFPFSVSLPSEMEDELPAVKLTIDNVDRQIVEAVRSITSPATVSLSLILASSPNNIERGPYVLKMRNVQYDAMSVSADLMVDDIYNEPYPGITYSPTNFPGLFP